MTSHPALAQSHATALGPSLPLASVQGTLALDLGPRTTPPPLPHRTSSCQTSPRTSPPTLVVLRDLHGPGEPEMPGGASSDVAPEVQSDLDAWAHRFVQAAVEIVGGDRPASQLLRWTSAEVYADLRRRAVLVARASGRADAQQGPWRSQPIRPQVVSVRSTFVGPRIVEASARVRYGARSRAVALRFERRRGRWTCRALEFA